MQQTARPPDPPAQRFNPAVAKALAPAFYASVVASADTARARAQSAFAITNAIAVTLVAAAVLGQLADQPAWVRALGAAAVVGWIIVSGLFLHAIVWGWRDQKTPKQKEGAAADQEDEVVGAGEEGAVGTTPGGTVDPAVKEDEVVGAGEEGAVGITPGATVDPAVKEDEVVGADAFVSTVIARAAAAQETITRRTIRALVGAAVAALLTIAALGAVLFHAPEVVVGDVVITAPEVTALQGLCPNVTDKIHGEIEVGSIDSEFVEIRPVRASCPGLDSILEIPRASILAEHTDDVWPVPKTAP